MIIFVGMVYSGMVIVVDVVVDVEGGFIEIVVIVICKLESI